MDSDIEVQYIAALRRTEVGNHERQGKKEIDQIGVRQAAAGEKAKKDQ